MKILHWLKKENSGLFRTVVELAKYEERQGHKIALREPSQNNTFYGFKDDDFDIHCIHSQINPHYYKDKKPKVLFLHGEPDYGMLVRISTEAIMDLIPVIDCMIAFNKDEAEIWNSFKRTYIIPKGVDLEVYKPIEVKKKLPGDPAILYIEHWRQFRHPLHVFIAIEKAIRKHNSIKFYPFGCPKDQVAFWNRLIRNNRYSIFTPGLFISQKNVSNLINTSDIVISPVFPSYGRVSLEAMACNKPVIAYKSNPHADYKCEPYNSDDMAEKIIQCIEEKPNNQRKYAEKYLSANDMAIKAIEIYRRFLN